MRMVFRLTAVDHAGRPTAVPDTMVYVPDDTVTLTRYELVIDEQPVIAMSLWTHPEVPGVRRYHTVCRRVGDDIDEMEL